MKTSPDPPKHGTEQAPGQVTLGRRSQKWRACFTAVRPSSRSAAAASPRVVVLRPKNTVAAGCTVSRETQYRRGGIAPCHPCHGDVGFVSAPEAVDARIGSDP